MKGYLHLSNGGNTGGELFGAIASPDIDEELVFSTCMTGYVESMTDPSFLQDRFFCSPIRSLEIMVFPKKRKTIMECI